ncbi:hypothetical protein GLO73106DRAFT_00017700 [Gloeocapsa sp. PCC 73106]|nr:hypothetical protein GLO73106DRAFT_00017700 [Gloeocapsa sp. PCC 73106]
MCETNFLFEFSRHYCLTICAVMVPANLVLTGRTIFLALTRASQSKLTQTAWIGVGLVSILLLHVFSWFAIGVVMTPSYVLIALASLCLTINLLALFPTITLTLPLLFETDRIGPWRPKLDYFEHQNPYPKSPSPESEV